MRIFLIALWSAAFLLQAIAFSQSSETTLHNFAGGADGADPLGDLVYDSSTGLVYGTTDEGGGSSLCTKGCGTVFSISPNGSPYKTLYGFAGGTDGANPQAGLVIDQFGNLYGTTYNGGAHGFGTVFKLMPIGGGMFTESVLYSFPGGKPGEHPLSRLVLDPSGNLYGTTYAGGSGHGVVFVVSPSGSETVLFTFSAVNGSHPRAGVVFDPAGNLWGTTSVGGVANLGTVFRLSFSGSVWTETFLYSFTGPGGANPYAEVTIDSLGNVFGTTKFGGTPTCGFNAAGCGVIFELTPRGGGFTETPIYSFTGAADGAEPMADVTLVLDATGFRHLFGTASGAGTLGGTCPAKGCGTAFELCSIGSSCSGSTKWTEYTLFDFAGKHGGKTPASGMLVFSPVVTGSRPLGFPPSGRGTCTSGCMTTPSSGGSTGNGTIDRLSN